MSWFDSLHPSQYFFSRVRTGLWVEQVLKLLAQGRNTVTLPDCVLEQDTLSAA